MKEGVRGVKNGGQREWKVRREEKARRVRKGLGGGRRMGGRIQ